MFARPIQILGIACLVLCSESCGRWSAPPSRAITIRPHSQGLLISHASLPGETVRLQFPERFSVDELTPYGDLHIDHSRFTMDVNSEWVYESARGKAHIIIRARPADEFVDLLIEIQNRSADEVFEKSYWMMCADVVSAPVFAEPMETFDHRTDVVIGGKLASVFLQSAIPDSVAHLMAPVFPIRIMPLPREWRLAVDNGYGWILVDTELDNGFVAVHSETCRWTLAFVADPAANVSLNMLSNDLVAHRCVHSNILIPEIRSGASFRARGRLYISERPPEALLADYLSLISGGG